MLTEKILARIVKCLNLTQSDFDGEALSAIRRANEILKKENANWEILLAGKPDNSYRQKNTYEYWARKAYRSYRPHHPQEEIERINKMLNYCMNYVTGSGVDFIDSLNHQWQTKKRLSEKQIKALEKFYERARERNKDFCS